MKLGEVADITIGVLLNREKNINGEEQYKLFSIKKYEENEEYETFYTNKDLDDKLTENGDILFRLVAPNKVIYVDNNNANLLVPSQLCIIRTNKKILDPIFLKWYLENTPGKEKVMLEITGSSIQKISVNALRNIEIPDISIEKQKAIADLIELWNNEKTTLDLLINSKEKLYNSIIEEIVRESEKD